MDEVQLNSILDSYKQAINAILNRLDAQDGMIQATREKAEYIEHLIFDEVINPAKEAMEQTIYDAGLEDFSGKYGDKLSAYGDSLKAIEGDDFDIMRQAYDGYRSIEGEKPDEAMYVDELVNVIDEQLSAIREKLGAPADAEITVTQDGTGETSVEVGGEEVSEAPAEDTITDVEEESDPEELAKLEEELMAFNKKK